MKGYRCDQCQAWQIGDPKISLTGFVENHGGILLPEAFHHYYFCCKECFKQWMKEAVKQ